MASCQLQLLKKTDLSGPRPRYSKLNMCQMCCQLCFAGLLDKKVFPLRLSSLGGKSLFCPAGSLASATANSLFWRGLPIHSFSGWKSPPIGLSSVPMPSEAYQPSKTGKGYPGAPTCPQHEKINVKNSDSSHRLALSFEHSRMFRFQGDSLLKSLYLLWERKRDNKT